MRPAYIKRYPVSMFKNWLSCGHGFTLHSFFVCLGNCQNEIHATTLGPQNILFKKSRIQKGKTSINLPLALDRCTLHLNGISLFGYKRPGSHTLYVVCFVRSLAEELCFAKNVNTSDKERFIPNQLLFTVLAENAISLRAEKSCCHSHA